MKKGVMKIIYTFETIFNISKMKFNINLEKKSNKSSKQTCIFFQTMGRL